MEKRCNKCAKTLPVAAFNKSAMRKDGLQTYCRSCSSTYYTNNRELRIAQAAKIAASRKLEIQRWILDYLGDHPCVDCGENDPVVLEFDHVRDVKVAGIADMVAHGRAIGAIKAEIAKCEVRCANCHRRRTAKVGNWKAWNI